MGGRLRYERLLIGACLAGMVVLSWIWLLDMAHDMSDMPTAGMPDMPAAIDRWGVPELGGLFVMWAVMMVAMMVPSAAPMVLAFVSLDQRRRAASGPFAPTSCFVLGYVAVWTGYSVAAALAQWLLHQAAGMTPGMAVTSPLVTGGLLIAAGVYQWTPLKERCLAGCRSPLGFLMTRWREGRWGAWRMGLEHGSYCVGCCWILMALLFVTGVMNLAGVAVIAVFVIAEKMVPGGPLFGRVTGALLAIAGLVFAVCGLSV